MLTTFSLYHPRCLIAVAAIYMTGSGCARVQQQQYYMAMEKTGYRAIYKLTLCVYGIGAEKFKLTSGYVPASVVDALNGDLEEPKDLYARESDAKRNAKVLQAINKRLSDELLKLAKDSNWDNTDERDKTDKIDRLLQWYAKLYQVRSLSSQDLVSIGERGTTRVYGFRKLVFFVATKVIPVSQFESELKNVGNAVVAVAQAFRSVRDAKAAATAAKVTMANQRRQSVIDYIHANPKVNKWSGTNFLDIFSRTRGMTP